MARLPNRAPLRHKPAPPGEDLHLYLRLPSPGEAKRRFQSRRAQIHCPPPGQSKGSSWHSPEHSQGLGRQVWDRWSGGDKIHIARWPLAPTETSQATCDKLRETSSFSGVPKVGLELVNAGGNSRERDLLHVPLETGKGSLELGTVLPELTRPSTTCLYSRTPCVRRSLA